MTRRRRSPRPSAAVTSRRLWIALLSFVLLAAGASSLRLAATTARDAENPQPPVSDAIALPARAQISDTQPPVTDEIAPSALAQIQALLDEKASRTPAQQKMDSQLIYAAKMARGQAIAAGVSVIETDVPHEAGARIVVDVTAQVTEALLNQWRALGATVLSSSEHVPHRAAGRAADADRDDCGDAAGDLRAAEAGGDDVTPVRAGPACRRPRNRHAATPHPIRSRRARVVHRHGARSSGTTAELHRGPGEPGIPGRVHAPGVRRARHVQHHGGGRKDWRHL